MSEKTSIRRDLWSAAHAVLSTELGDARARELSRRIVDGFSARRGNSVGGHRVSPEALASIRSALLAQDGGILKIARLNGVGTSTVQRVASELKDQGLLP